MAALPTSQTSNNSKHSILSRIPTNDIIPCSHCGSVHNRLPSPHHQIVSTPHSLNHHAPVQHSHNNHHQHQQNMPLSPHPQLGPQAAPIPGAAMSPAPAAIPTSGNHYNNPQATQSMHQIGHHSATAVAPAQKHRHLHQSPAAQQQQTIIPKSLPTQVVYSPGPHQHSNNNNNNTLHHQHQLHSSQVSHSHSHPHLNPHQQSQLQAPSSSTKTQANQSILFNGSVDQQQQQQLGARLTLPLRDTPLLGPFRLDQDAQFTTRVFHLKPQLFETLSKSLSLANPQSATVVQELQLRTYLVGPPGGPAGSNSPNQNNNRGDSLLASNHNNHHQHLHYQGKALKIQSYIDLHITRRPQDN